MDADEKKEYSETCKKVQTYDNILLNVFIVENFFKRGSGYMDILKAETELGYVFQHLEKPRMTDLAPFKTKQLCLAKIFKAWLSKTRNLLESSGSELGKILEARQVSKIAQQPSREKKRKTELAMGALQNLFLLNYAVSQLTQYFFKMYVTDHIDRNRIYYSPTPTPHTP